MNSLTLALASLRARAAGTALSILLVAFGVMLATLVILFGQHVERRLTTDGQGIDMVIGAKGSPLQLILSSVYHIDMPTGNIPAAEATRWTQHPAVRQAIPLALGDNWRGYRIVGTTHDYAALYNAAPADGRLWAAPFEAVAGADVPLAPGAQFAGAHGLSGGPGHDHDHDEHAYTIVGRLARTGTVVDRLILTGVASVQELHGQHGHDHAHDHGHHHAHDHEEDHEGEVEITALLLALKSPLDQMNFPRLVNRESALQAAHPASEMARLSGMLGIGARSFTVLAALLVGVAALTIFSGIAGSLEGRKKDLAVLRALGFSRRRVFTVVASEGLLMAGAGIVLGLALGFGGFAVLAATLAPLKAGFAHAAWSGAITALAAATLAAGFVAALVPALRAARIDAADQLSRDV